MSVPLMCGQGCAFCGSGMEIGTLAMSDAQEIALDAKSRLPGSFSTASSVFDWCCVYMVVKSVFITPSTIDD